MTSVGMRSSPYLQDCGSDATFLDGRQLLPRRPAALADGGHASLALPANPLAACHGTFRDASEASQQRFQQQQRQGPWPAAQGATSPTPEAVYGATCSDRPAVPSPPAGPHAARSETAAAGDRAHTAPRHEHNHTLCTSCSPRPSSFSPSRLGPWRNGPPVRPAHSDPASADPDADVGASPQAPPSPGWRPAGSAAFGRPCPATANSPAHVRVCGGERLAAPQRPSPASARALAALAPRAQPLAGPPGCFSQPQAQPRPSPLGPGQGRGPHSCRTPSASPSSSPSPACAQPCPQTRQQRTATEEALRLPLAAQHEHGERAGASAAAERRSLLAWQECPAACSYQLVAPPSPRKHSGLQQHAAAAAAWDLPTTTLRYVCMYVCADTPCTPLASRTQSHGAHLQRAAMYGTYTTMHMPGGCHIGHGLPSAVRPARSGVPMMRPASAPQTRLPSHTGSLGSHAWPCPACCCCTGTGTGTPPRPTAGSPCCMTMRGRGRRRARRTCWQRRTLRSGLLPARTTISTQSSTTPEAVTTAAAPPPPRRPLRSAGPRARRLVRSRGRMRMRTAPAPHAPELAAALCPSP